MDGKRSFFEGGRRAGLGKAEPGGISNLTFEITKEGVIELTVWKYTLR